jgi:DNA primase
MITQDTIDKILFTARIEEVVGDFVNLKKRGVNMLGLCPFHNEKTPSFTVSPAKGIYKCFGCGKGGNSLNFIMDHEQLSYPEALRYLADKYNIEIEETEQRQEEIAHKTERESLYILLAAAQKHYSEILYNDEEGRTIGLEYLKERQLNPDIIKSFGLGWSQKGRDAFSNWALKNGFTKEYLVKTGMSFETDQGTLLDRYHERVMFPIHNLSGKVVGFGGRIIRSTGKEAKYINSPETEVYNKSKILYGLNQAKKAIRQQDECIIVEGYMDVLAMVQAGIENVAASSGTSLTEDQLRLVKRFTDNVIFLFDGDAAGQKAALRAIDMALEQELNVKMLLLPPEHDPDSFVKAFDLEEVKTYFENNSQNFVQFRCSLLPEDEKRDPIKKSKVVKELLASVLLINDNIKRTLFIKEIEKALAIDEKTLYEELRRMFVEKVKKDNKTPEVNISLPPAEKQVEEAPIADTSTIRQEKAIVKALLLYGDKVYDEEHTVSQYMLQELTDLEWEDAGCQKVIEAFQAAAEKGEIILDFTNMIAVEDTEVHDLVTGLITERYSLSDNWTKALGRPVVKPVDNYREEIHSALNHFKLRKVMKLIHKNEEDLAKATGEEELNELLAVHIHLSEMKRSIAKQIGAVIV